MNYPTVFKYGDGKRIAPEADAVRISPETSKWSWVPIRSLAPRHRDRLASHLLSLDANDRYLRFGYAASDEQIISYVMRLDFEFDELFGIFNRRLELLATAHLAHSTTSSPGKPSRMAEFGVSVLAKARGRGYGQRLFDRAVLHARNRSVDAMFIHALSGNTAMLKIARRAGATVIRDGPDSKAWLELQPDTFASHMGQMVERHAAELDYRMKQHVCQVGGILVAISELKTHLGASSHSAKK